MMEDEYAYTSAPRTRSPLPPQPITNDVVYTQPSLLSTVVTFAIGNMFHIGFLAVILLWLYAKLTDQVVAVAAG